ncbi:MAG: hypothetical protein ABI577_17485, partial [bacterium]
SAEDLAAARPAERARAQLRKVALHKGSRWAERGAVLTMLALASLAFLGMLFLCGYIAYAAGPWDPGLWLTVPFAALTGFGTFQIFRSARRSAYRGRPWALIQRAFRDSVRVWGSGSLVSNVLLTSTATASVAGAAIVPVVTSSSTPFDLFLIDAPTGQVYRVDLATNTSFLINREAGALTPTALGATASVVTLEDGKKLPSGSLIAVVQTAGDRAQGLVGFRPNSNKATAIARIQPPLPGAYFAGAAGRLFALQPDGTLSSIDLKSGRSDTISKLTIPAGPIAYDSKTNSLLVVSGTNVAQVNPTTGTVVTSAPSGTPAGFQACGLALGSKGRLWLTEAGTGAVFFIDSNPRTVHELHPLGDAPAHPCALAVALRR